MDNILTTMEAAEHAGVTRITILRWIREGKIEPVSYNVTRGTGCGYKIRQSELDRYIHGWTLDAPARFAETEVMVKVEPIGIDKRSLRTAAANLRKKNCLKLKRCCKMENDWTFTSPFVFRIYFRPYNER